MSLFPSRPASSTKSVTGNMPLPADVVVNVWHAAASENDPGDLERHCECLLDDSDRERAMKLRRQTTRNQHVVGRGMVRHLLSHGCDGVVEPHAIRFSTLPHGKPVVSEPCEVCQPFNVSHTSGLVIGTLAPTDSGLAIDAETGDTLLGVDVERLDRRTDAGLADRYFSKPEVEYVRAQSSELSRQMAFLRVWTLKESFIKAIGTGLHTPLAGFAFRDIDSDSPRIEMLDPKLQSDVAWKFFPINPRPGFIAAVAVGCQSSETTAKLEVRNFEDLLTR
jgi:4'-phosphopantetheinyl transferase